MFASYKKKMNDGHTDTAKKIGERILEKRGFSAELLKDVVISADVWPRLSQILQRDVLFHVDVCTHTNMMSVQEEGTLYGMFYDHTDNGPNTMSLFVRREVLCNR